MARPSDISDVLTMTLIGAVVLGGLTYAAGPPLVAAFGISIKAYSASAYRFALAQTLVLAMGTWLIGRAALGRHVRGYEERLAPWFTGGMFLWSNSVHNRTTTVSGPDGGPIVIGSWSAYAGSTEVNGTPIDLAIERTTWTLMVSFHTGHRLWYQHWDNQNVRQYYESPPSRWGAPATPDDRLDRLSAIGPEALEQMIALVAEFDRYDPDVFIHPDMVRVVLYCVFDPPDEALWADAGPILNRVVDLALSVQPAEPPIRTVDAVDVFYRDWFTAIQADHRLRAWLGLGGFALLFVLMPYWLACEASFR